MSIKDNETIMKALIRLKMKVADYSDIKFLKEMIKHHEMALSMSEGALEYTERDEVKELAKNIIKAQTAEIKQMKTWIKEWSK